MDKYFDPVVLRLIDILKKALPDAAEEDIFWGYHFVTGALMLTLARTGRIDKLSQGLCHSDDYAAVKARMARFMAAGFRSEEHTSELQSLMRISYAVFCLKKKNTSETQST